MKWQQLLDATRVRDLYNAGRSQRVPEETRGEFERDYGRTVFSTPVRRLQDKAQVFPLEPNDSVRTRLTHSLEVSTIARNMALTVGDWLAGKREVSQDQAQSIGTIAATCGIIHDLGNPPFGHAGEQAISDWFRERLKEDAEFKGAFEGMNEQKLRSQYACDFLLFDGNPQTLRIVSKLQMVSDSYGMNLTCGTMSAACKYVAASHETEPRNSIRKKPGFFASENDLVAKIRERTGTGTSRNPITFLVEAADDLVYATVDLEDGIKKGALTWDEFEVSLRKALDDVASKELLDRALKLTKDKVDKGPLPIPRGERDEAMAQVFRTFALALLVPVVVTAFKNSYESIMQGTFESTLVETSDACKFIESLKDLARRYVHPNQQILRLEVMGRQIVQGLMDLLWFGAKEVTTEHRAKDFQMKVYHLMSKNYRNVFQEARTRTDLPNLYCRLQLVTDQVCGMTDTFAQTMHKQLYNG